MRLPLNIVQKLQLVQETARLLIGAVCFACIPLVLILAVFQRISRHKVLLVSTFKALNIFEPEYLTVYLLLYESA